MNTHSNHRIGRENMPGPIPKFVNEGQFDNSFSAPRARIGVCRVQLPIVPPLLVIRSTDDKIMLFH